jgi:hypothetical protein
VLTSSIGEVLVISKLGDADAVVGATAVMSLW